MDWKIKMSILPKATYRFNAVPIKIPMPYFTETEQTFQKFMWTPNSLSNFEKENKVGGITIPGIKLYYKDTISKTVWYWHKNTLKDQCNRLESPEINSSLYDQLIFDKGYMSIQWSKDSIFNK